MNLLQVILPVIIMLIIGMICREKKLISEEGIDRISYELYRSCMEEDLQSDHTSSSAAGNHGSTCICILQDIRWNLC